MQDKSVDKWNQYKHCLIWTGLPYEEDKLSRKQAMSLINKHHAWMLQNIYDWDCGHPTNFWAIIKDRYSEDDYSRKTRKYLKKANERFVYTIIDSDLLRQQGYSVYLKAYSHYSIHDGYKESQHDFMYRIDMLTSSLYDIWGAIDRETGNLEAYSICRKDGDVCIFESSKANPEFLRKHYVMYGLYDARNRYYLADKGYRFVLSSRRSISEHSNIQSFLVEKFAFRKAYCRFELYYITWLKIIISMLYPFRALIKFPKLRNLLQFVEIRREKF